MTFTVAGRILLLVAVAMGTKDISTVVESWKVLGSAGSRINVRLINKQQESEIYLLQDAVLRSDPATLLDAILHVYSYELEKKDYADDLVVAKDLIQATWKAAVSADKRLNIREVTTTVLYSEYWLKYLKAVHDDGIRKDEAFLVGTLLKMWEAFNIIDTADPTASTANPYPAPSLVPIISPTDDPTSSVTADDWDNETLATNETIVDDISICDACGDQTHFITYGIRSFPQGVAQIVVPNPINLTIWANPTHSTTSVLESDIANREAVPDQLEYSSNAKKKVFRKLKRAVKKLLKTVDKSWFCRMDAEIAQDINLFLVFSRQKSQG